MIRLSDLQAPPWIWREGERRITMRPLSLATFAEAELYGCGMDDLMNPDPQESVTAWVGLYAFLSRQEPSEALTQQLVQNPELMAAFVQFVQASLTPPDAKEKEVSGSHRRNKDPRDRIGVPGGPTMKSEGTGGAVDYTALLDLSRYARISLGDLFGMTLRGLSALSRHVADNPPMPNPLTGQVD